MTRPSENSPLLLCAQPLRGPADRDGRPRSLQRDVTDDDGRQFLGAIPTSGSRICPLAQLFLDAFGDRFGRPAVLNPVFAQSSAVGGADADLISDGMLLEIKTTINPRIDGAWIRQLLGYLLLDTAGEFEVTSLGLYLARQGRLLVWPLPDALDSIAGQPVDLPAVRLEFATFLGTLGDA